MWRKIPSIWSDSLCLVAWRCQDSPFLMALFFSAILALSARVVFLCIENFFIYREIRSIFFRNSCFVFDKLRYMNNIPKFNGLKIFLKFAGKSCIINADLPV